MTRVLFVCTRNSARSQMAEAFLKEMGKGDFEAESAGLEASSIQPEVIEVMKEEGIDISANSTQTVFDLVKQNRSYDFVITVCDLESAEKCPLFPGKAIRFYWPFSDPAAVSGSGEEKLKKIREIRNAIKTRISQFIKELHPY